MYTLSLHDALPICVAQAPETTTVAQPQGPGDTVHAVPAPDTVGAVGPDLLDTAVVEAPPPPAEPIRPDRDHGIGRRSEEHTSELQSLTNRVCPLLLATTKAWGLRP